MEKHFLVAVGDDLSSLHGIRFVASFFSQRKDLKLTLFNVTLPPYSYDSDKKVHSRLTTSSSNIDPAKLEAHPSLQESQKLLLSRGFLPQNISMKLFTKRSSTVKDIIHEGRKGQYDAVILGRRGYNIFEQALATSVSREILDQEIDYPIWICRRTEEGRKNVLLCVDETEPSLRIADHVGFILQTEKDHGVTLLYVDEGGGKKAESIMDQARRRLTDNGVEEERIQNKVIWTQDVPKALLSEAEHGAYAVVAMGRGGAHDAGFLKKWLMGSRSLKVMEALDKSVLWLSK